MTLKTYETQPLEIYEKARELRLDHWKDVMTARERGKLLVACSQPEPLALVAGFGDYALHPGGPYAVNVSINPTFSVEAMEATESKGFSRDMCGYFRCDMGSIYLNRYLFGGPFPKPDFYFMLHDCEARGKWGQAFAEALDIPYFVFELPLGPPEERSDRVTDYIASQLYDFMEFMVKLTGRECDDEKLIEAIENTFLIKKLFAEIVLLNSKIPAPLDSRMISSLMAVPMWKPHHKLSVDFLKAWRDEVLYRIEKEVATVPLEQCRLMLDVMPPWPVNSILRAKQREYGAVMVGIYIYAINNGSYEVKDDAFVPAKTPTERGIEIKTREEAVAQFARHLSDEWRVRHVAHVPTRISDIARFARQWQVDGVMLHFNRACPGLSMGTSEVRLALREAGIPVMSLEASGVDLREINEVEVADAIDRFMEVLGTKRLED